MRRSNPTRSGMDLAVIITDETARTLCTYEIRRIEVNKQDVHRVGARADLWQVKLQCWL